MYSFFSKVITEIFSLPLLFLSYESYEFYESSNPQ